MFALPIILPYTFTTAINMSTIQIYNRVAIIQKVMNCNHLL